MKTPKVPVAIIGCGQFGTKRALACQQHSHFDLVGVYDANNILSRRLASATNSLAFTSLNQLLTHPTIEAICICTPNYLHASQSVRAIERDKHVLVEKPAGIKFQDFTKLQTALNKKKSVAWQYGHNHRFFGSIATLANWHARLAPISEFKLVMNSGRDKHSVGWFTDRQKAGGGTLIDNGHHLLDLLFWLTNIQTWQLTNCTYSPKIINHCETSAMITLTNNTQQLATIETHWRKHQPYIEVKLISENGIVTATEQKVTVKINKKTHNFETKDQPGSALQAGLNEWYDHINMPTVERQKLSLANVELAKNIFSLIDSAYQYLK